MLQETIEIRRATAEDFDKLAMLNRELIEDEKHRNPMTVPELKERFLRFVNCENWTVDLFIQNGEIVGFATHRFEPDNAEPSGQRIYLRQFYISRQHRRSGNGRSALELLIQSRFNDKERIVLEVVETNPGGKAFWSRTGFDPYSTIMERVVEKATTE
ncbi:GNAT family N-acetyltransferase [Phyllobacterium sophorae]|uniref:GNAT family N-acetyltransferase n=1 Tax=Phyllobacterium sophorae TaxID=1520277 RepID=A0A2P7B6Y4_9HYPH|nr:GNAT family N-acetyltransferase [Phyllobacterium sophorae]